MESVTIPLKAVEQNVIVVMFIFQFYPYCNFGKYFNFGISTLMNKVHTYGIPVFLNVNQIDYVLSAWEKKDSEFAMV